MATITLDDVVVEQMQTNETLGALIDKTKVMIELQEAGVTGLDILIDKFDDMLNFMKGEAFEADRRYREALRERSAPPPFVGPPAPGSPPPTGDPQTYDFGGAGITTLGIGAGVFAKNVLEGFVGAVRDSIRNFNASFTARYERMVQRFDASNKKFMQSFGRGLENLRNGFTRVTTGISTGISNFGATISNWYNNFANRFLRGGNMTTLSQNLSKMFEPVRRFGERIANTPFFKALGAFGRILGKILYPVGLIFSAFTGAKDEIEKEGEQFGILGNIALGFVGAAKGLLGFVLWPFEFIKDVLSFISEKLGFKGFAKFLDSFDIMKDGVDLVFGSLNDLGTWLGGKIFGIVDFFSNLKLPELPSFSGIKEKFANLFSEIGIPRIEFEIPVIGKKVGFGPFYPFKDDGGDAPAVPSTSPVATQESSQDSFKMGSVDRPSRLRGREIGGSGEALLSDKEVAELQTKKKLTARALQDFESDSSNAFETYVDDDDPFGEVKRRYTNPEVQAQYESLQRESRLADYDYGEAKSNQTRALGRGNIGKIKFLQSRGVLPPKFERTFGVGEIDRMVDDYYSAKADVIKPPVDVTTEVVQKETMENVASSQAAPNVIIQDNSVNSSNQNSNTVIPPTPMSSPTNDNRTRASAYSG